MGVRSFLYGEPLVSEESIQDGLEFLGLVPADGESGSFDSGQSYTVELPNHSSHLVISVLLLLGPPLPPDLLDRDV